ncbi:MBL fold metallo-hydrolase [Bacillus pseudomycoides]|uniref:MBL fold metallo-hydrolase n=1 Tax=Bacillus pseudomycoides TaxID=64104 RepID=A0AA91V9R2_9BACI|nr:MULTISPECIES: MBL fold metallo-hydrolase [Bacillus]PEB50496.1 MBL fold metallo-hydrolase [Bacillus sp. AFS098217]PED81051.1 MBL fold metallo-hydrolase [Bacillus pseudomycoides]PEU05473.1 MBL fold metallo-hydrolase [Bacillus sp. AFS019443]PEU18072.1 MBL fold metallo-hydrolase [Bacillus sp. AFS014408]PFW62217.1 MBL fold metallo-hydrolase [Bacillus sp. AFS075034]
MYKEYVSEHFVVEKLGEGIFAAIAKDGGGSLANAGFIDMGNQTIIFDTFNTQQAAVDLKKIAEEITGHSISWVINSHWHGDHIRGNQVFKSCNIISSHKTYKQMAEIHPFRIDKQKQDIEGLHKYIHSLQDQFKQTHDEGLRKQILFLNQLAISLPTLQLVLPQYSFQNEFTIHGSKRTARLITLGGGHSICDTILYLPEDRVCFMGDLLFVKSHPTFFTESNLKEWQNILEMIEEFEIDKVVPGHGSVGIKSDLRKVIEYIEELTLLVKESINIDEIQCPSTYKNWHAPEVFTQNLQHLKKVMKLPAVHNNVTT